MIENNLFHCSGTGTKHTLRLKCKDEQNFKLSHLSFRKAPNCTSNAKTVIFFVTDTEIPVEELKIFDDMEKDQVQAKLKQLHIGAQAHQIVIEDGETEFEVMAHGANDWYIGK